MQRGMIVVLKLSETCACGKVERSRKGLETVCGFFVPDVSVSHFLYVDRHSRCKSSRRTYWCRLPHFCNVLCQGTSGSSLLIESIDSISSLLYTVLHFYPGSR